MLLVDLLAAVILAALVAYAVLGGADFGGGVWDLLAWGPRKQAQRQAIADAMGPVWEANHVWLIFVITLLFTGFPRAYALLNIALFLPLHLALLGIVLRGAAFVFRSYGPPLGEGARRWGLVFGVASLLTPFVLGAALGAVSTGDLRLTDEGVAPGAWRAWLAPEALGIGLLAVAASAYLAAVYLTVETRGELREDFRTRALLAWVAVALLAILLVPLLATGAPHLLPSPAQAAPVVAGGLLAALASLGGLLARRFTLARFFAAAQVTILLVGWGALLQYPYLVFPDVLLVEAAAEESTLRVTLLTVAVGTLLLAPSLWFLFRVFKGKTPGVEGGEAPPRGGQ